MIVGPLPSLGDTHNSLNRPNARDILKQIIPAGPIQPDGGYTSASISMIEELVAHWEENGCLSFLAKVEKLPAERRKILFNEEQFVFWFQHTECTRLA